MNAIAILLCFLLKKGGSQKIKWQSVPGPSYVFSPLLYNLWHRLALTSLPGMDWEGQQGSGSDCCWETREIGKQGHVLNGLWLGNISPPWSSTFEAFVLTCVEPSFPGYIIFPWLRCGWAPSVISLPIMFLKQEWKTQQEEPKHAGRDTSPRVCGDVVFLERPRDLQQALGTARGHVLYQVATASGWYVGGTVSCVLMPWWLGIHTSILRTTLQLYLLVITHHIAVSS